MAKGEKRTKSLSNNALFIFLSSIFFVIFKNKVFFLGNVLGSSKIAAKLFEETSVMLENLHMKKIYPNLAVILVGNNPASELYVKKKKIACDELGIEFELLRFAENISQRDILQIINDLNHKISVNAILVQIPLPKQLDSSIILNTVSPLKDVDGFTAFNLGLLSYGKEEIVSCTAQGIVKLLESTGTTIEGSNACIINHSIIVGRPLSQLLLNRGATVTVCHAKTTDLAMHTKNADILITAVGKPGLINGDMVKPGAVVIDAGIARKNGKTVGDVDFESVKDVASYITPVPGGIGPMTIACLVNNVAKLAMLHNQ